MGWYGNYSTNDEIIRELTTPDAPFLAVKVTSYGNHIWAIQQLPDGKKLIVLMLVRGIAPNRMYKPMSEDMQPYYYDCPLQFLARADEFSSDWRANVRKFHEQSRSTFIVGDRVEVYGKPYTVTGTVRRSYLLTNGDGNTYRSTAGKMRRI